MSDDDWYWTVSVRPPGRLDHLGLNVEATCSKDIDDPLEVARLIGKHVAREFIERTFETEDMTSA